MSSIWHGGPTRSFIEHSKERYGDIPEEISVFTRVLYYRLYTVPDRRSTGPDGTTY